MRGKPWEIMNNIFIKKGYILFNSAIFLWATLLGFISFAQAADKDRQLYQIGSPYIKYFSDRALDTLSGFNGLTRSFQLYLGGNTPEDEALINYGASNYDQTIMGKISLAGGSTTILDTYVDYFNRLSEAINPVFNCNGSYYDANGNPLLYGPYRIIRILGRDVPGWWNTWDWIVDTGAAPCIIIYALDGFQETQKTAYKDLAVLLGDYILKLQDTDGGIRYGPKGMYHYPEGASDFYWKLKSTEQNERILYALEAIFTVTKEAKYTQAIAQLKSWLKSMYDLSVHLFRTSATFDGTNWEKSDFGEVATDVTALAPVEVMFEDSFFGATPQDRYTEIDAMFGAIESRTAFLNGYGKPVFYRFSVSQVPDPQKGDYGSVEMSSQMALAYLKTAQIYSAKTETTRADAYLLKYATLIELLDNYFVVPADDIKARVAPYASYYLDRSVAGNVPTGTGYYTYDCQAALASVYFAFAKAGYDPCQLGGGSASLSTLNLSDVPWYQNTAYNSTGAASAQMILNYIREGAAQPLLTQTQVYEYARLPNFSGSDLNPDEIDKALGHFDPYDYLISNWSNGYDSRSDGNPYKGYNFTVDKYDPSSNPNAISQYMRDICHWMAYTVTKEDWWKDGPLVARPNTPAVVPIYGTYNHWVTIKGFSASVNPCPDPHHNPFNVPDFTVYGFWIKDPLVDGIGKDTYKTADECRINYFLPLATGDKYQGMFIQVAEPAPISSKASIKIERPHNDIANLQFAGIQIQGGAINYSLIKGLKSLSAVKKQSWKDVVDARLLLDREAVAAFSNTIKGQAVYVRNPVKKNADFYLLPFGKNTRPGSFLVSGVVMLDAYDGHFKEAAWTKKPEVLLQVDRSQAVYLTRAYILNDYYNKIRLLLRMPAKKSLVERANLYRKYVAMLYYLDKAKLELSWQANGYSPSPYKPYWKIDASGYVWVVTQDKKVIPVQSW